MGLRCEEEAFHQCLRRGGRAPRVHRGTITVTITSTITSTITVAIAITTITITLLLLLLLLARAWGTSHLEMQVIRRIGVHPMCLCQLTAPTFQQSVEGQMRARPPFRRSARYVSHI